MEMVRKRDVDVETNTETWTTFKKQHEMNAWQAYIRQMICVFQELDANFNCMKIQWMTDWVLLIHRYGALQLYSGERHKLAHEPNCKEGWNASNNNPKYQPQVITCQCSIL
jgi:hypothetical protein